MISYENDNIVDKFSIIIIMIMLVIEIQVLYATLQLSRIASEKERVRLRM